MARILILGGTKEASALAAERHAAGDDVTTSLAGRTREPKPLAGTVRTGGFGGSAGLAKTLRDGAYDLLIDATHPFATQISANALEAAQLAGVPIEQHRRIPWKAQPGDGWQHVASIAQAVGTIPAAARVLLALGSQHITPFATRTDIHFIIRRIDSPDAPLPFTSYDLLIERPRATAAEEAALLEEHGVTHIVCRNSGGTGAYAKIEAARTLGLPVIMIARP